MKNRKSKKPIIVAVSGGFDPIHIGHIRLFEAAKKLGDKLIVILNNDNWLRKKKGFIFMPQRERKELFESMRWVDKVILTGHKPNTKDMSVCRELKRIRPDIFAQGGDRNVKNIPPCEVRLQKELGYKVVENVGRGGKIQSSSWLLAKCADKLQSKFYRPWGYFIVIEEGKNFKVKKVVVEPKGKLSLQFHKQRSEHWVVLKGRARVELDDKIFCLGPNQSIDIPIKSKHRLENPSSKPLEIIEIQSGGYLGEDDIIRIDDKYER